MKDQSRFAFIDALRGLAALSVVLFHIHAGTAPAVFFATLPQFIQNCLKHGYLGVHVFFVISGFVTAYSLKKVKIDFAYFGNFTLRRLIRLTPPYWVTIALVIFLRYISNFIIADRVASLPSGQQLIANMFYLQNILGLGNISDVFWTLCIEIQFYLIFCLILFFTQRVQFILNSSNQLEPSTIILTFGSVSLLAAAWPLGLIEENLGDGLLFPYLYVFLMGAFTWWSFDKKIPENLFIFYVFIIFVACIFNWKTDSIFSVLTTVIIYLSGKRGNLQDWLNLGWLQYLGTISYSLYLTHSAVSSPFLNAGYRITKDSAIGGFLWFSIALIVSFVTAHCLWKFIEKPSAEFSRRFKPVVNQ